MKRIIAAVVALLLSACAGAPPAPVVPEPEPVAPAPRGVTLPSYETVALANGMQLVLMEKREVPLISFTALVRGGTLAEPANRSGTAALVAELLRKGAGGRDAAQFAQAVESAGGVITTAAGMEGLIVSGEFMARDAALMVELLGDLLQDPQLAKTEFDKLRERSIQQIRSMKDTSLRGLTGVYGDAFLFGTHPYGRSTIGTEAGLAATTYADVRRYFIEHVGADRTVLAVAGDFDAVRLRAQLERRFAGWRKATGRLPEVQAMAPHQGSRVLLIDKPDATQTYFYIGNVGVARDFPDRAALDLVNTVFGGRFTSMLNTALRVESGLTYGAGASLERYTQPGALAMVSFTQTDTTVQAIDLALATLERLRSEGLTEEQLASAKAYVLGQFAPDLETAGQLAAHVAELGFYGLPRGYIDDYAAQLNAVTLADARRVIDAVYPARENLTFVLIGNAAAIREQVRKYGEVVEMKISEPRFAPR